MPSVLDVLGLQDLAHVHAGFLVHAKSRSRSVRTTKYERSNVSPSLIHLRAGGFSGSDLHKRGQGVPAPKRAVGLQVNVDGYHDDRMGAVRIERLL